MIEQAVDERESINIRTGDGETLTGVVEALMNERVKFRQEVAVIYIPLRSLKLVTLHDEELMKTEKQEFV
jgi:hypothetical protein